MLLAPSRVETLAPGHAAVAVGVVAHCGEVWARNLVEVWFRDDGRRTMIGGTDHRAWLDSLPSLCGVLCVQSADGRTIAGRLVVHSGPNHATRTVGSRFDAIAPPLCPREVHSPSRSSRRTATHT